MNGSLEIDHDLDKARRLLSENRHGTAESARGRNLPAQLDEWNLRRHGVGYRSESS